MERIPTNNGVVRCSKAHGANEKAENIAIAKHFAEKYGHEIDLLPCLYNEKSPDAYNRTLGIEQEYKTNKTPTKGAIDTILREASKQANNIVLHVRSDISLNLLRAGIVGRVQRKDTIETLTVLRNGEDKTYTRAQIISNNFEL